MRREDKVKKPGRVDRRRGREEHSEVHEDVRFATKEQLITRVEPRTQAQAEYMHSIGQNILTIATGPAGTGKTFVCAAIAGLALKDKAVKRIIITRPAVEAGEKLGFLPGEKEDKYAPYVEPFEDVLVEVLGRTFYDYCVKSGAIKGRPFAYMRGHTFKNAIVILDEAQNSTPEQMKLFLTRVGENCKVIVNGDVRQKDIPVESGLADAVRRIAHVRRVGLVEFETEDIVRSGFCRDIVEAYER